MIDIALCSRKEDTFRIFKNSFNRFTHKVRPISADIFTADGIGMSTKVYNYKGFCIFTLYFQKFDRIVCRTERSEYFGVIYSRICLHLTVFHSIASRERDSGSCAAAYREARLSHIAKSLDGNLCKKLKKGFIVLGICRFTVQIHFNRWTCMSVRAVDKY